MELEINTADKHFDHIKTKGKNLNIFVLNGILDIITKYLSTNLASSALFKF